MFWCAEAFDSKQGVTGANLQYPDSGNSIKTYTQARYHWHGLLKADIDRHQLWNWYSEKYSSGKNRARCQIVPNTDGYSAAQYCSKYVTKALTDYDFLISSKHSLEFQKNNSVNSRISQ